MSLLVTMPQNVLRARDQEIVGSRAQYKKTPVQGMGGYGERGALFWGEGCSARGHSVPPALQATGKRVLQAQTITRLPGPPSF